MILYHAVAAYLAEPVGQVPELYIKKDIIDKGLGYGGRPAGAAVVFAQQVGNPIGGITSRCWPWTGCWDWGLQVGRLGPDHRFCWDNP